MTISKKIQNLLIAGLPVLAVLLQLMASPSCANTTTPPSGGPKDTIPPYLTKIEPLPGSVNVNTRKTEITFTFNEYVKVKDAKSIFLSPPQEKAPKFKIKGKSVVVYFEEPLDSNRTYALDLTNAICDNNEGNMYEGFTYIFSTGDRIDSMVVTGTVLDCNTLKPLQGATVLLYKDHADSAIFLHRPDAAIKTDDWGFFTLRNIQDTIYRMYALTDENNNNKYDPETESVAFLDSLLKPVLVVSDTLKELAKYDMKDTAHVMARHSEHELKVFREIPSKQMILKKERVDDRVAYITFMAPFAVIDSMWIKGVKPKNLITQFNAKKDSLEIWVNDQRKMPDTLRMYVNYQKTDTLGKLAPFIEEVKLVRPKAASVQKSSKKDLKKEDTTCVFTVEALPEMVEQNGFVAEFKL
ncbi:MAG: Ig-like domain-containing protein, partial [Bacteroidales bacterium]|nr:Ig-like domain-containing protein [Bacteroidales bacterium]